MKRTLYAAASAVAITAVVGGVYAAQSEGNEVVAVATAKIDLIQAITAAEKHVGGKAGGAEFERDKGQWVYEVEVVRDKIVVQVKVDPESGNVISATEDKDDD